VIEMFEAERAYEIKQLINNYYDIQKLRVATFNNIIAWVVENKQSLLDALRKSASQTKNETPTNIAIKLLENKKYAEFVEKFVLPASRKRNETQSESASQVEIETQKDGASQYKIEIHGKDASQFLGEAHQKSASRLELETQYKNASQSLDETQRKNASHDRSEAPNKTASQGDAEAHGKSAFYEKLKEIESLAWFHNKLYETEKELYVKIDVWSKDHPFRKQFLGRVIGIGPILSSAIIAWLCTERIHKVKKVKKIDGRLVIYEEKGKRKEYIIPPYALETRREGNMLFVRLPPVLKVAQRVSSLWKYAGFDPKQKRRKGKKADFNPEIRNLCWKITDQFNRRNCFGRKIIDKFKQIAKEKHPDWSKKHCFMHGRRIAAKMFLSAVWEVWRKMNNLPVSEPYSVEYLGHIKVTPEVWMEKGGD